MNTQTRQELLRVLQELSTRHPDVRLGQLIANLSCAAKGPAQEAVWDVEDEELLVAAREHLRRPGQSKSSVA
jgi:hypothetical protein